MWWFLNIVQVFHSKSSWNILKAQGYFSSTSSDFLQNDTLIKKDLNLNLDWLQDNSVEDGNLLQHN